MLTRRAFTQRPLRTSCKSRIEKSRASGMETLEPRQLLAADVMASSQLVFVTEDVPTAWVASPEVNVYQLSSDSSGIEQITNAIGEHQNVSSVKIYSHANSEAISLGATSLQVDNLAQYAAAR